MPCEMWKATSTSSGNGERDAPNENDGYAPTKACRHRRYEGYTPVMRGDATLSESQVAVAVFAIGASRMGRLTRAARPASAMSAYHIQL